MDDWLLLREYVERGSDAAFDQVVERHMDLVYTTSLREVRDAELAHDVTQAVFLILARKAGRLRRGTVLAGWLFTTARFAARNALRQEARRRQREERAGRELLRERERAGAEAGWDEIEPLLHEALAALKAGERDAILLRYLDGRSLKEVGAALGISESGAHMRLDRAIHKLRLHLRQRGVHVPAAALAGSLSLAAGEAPAAAVSSARITALARGRVTESPAAAQRAYQLTEGVMHAMNWIVLRKTAAGVLALLALGGGLAITARSVGFSPAAARDESLPDGPVPTAAELLARFAEHQARMQSYIYTSEETTRELGPGAGAPMEYRGEFRADVKGGRFARRFHFWGGGTPEWTREKPGYTSHLWDGKEHYTYTRGLNGQDNLAISRMGGRDKERNEQEIRWAHAGAPCVGNFQYDPARVDTLLQKARTLTVRPRTQIIRGAACYVLEGTTEFGAYTLWLDPKHGYNLARAEVRKRGGDRVLGQVLKPGSDVRQTLENLRFEQVAGTWVPMEAEIELHEHYPAPAEPRTPYRIHHRKLAFRLNPDFEALGSFKPDDVRDGTRVIIATPERKVFPLGSSEGIYRWKAGKLEPWSG